MPGLKPGRRYGGALVAAHQAGVRFAQSGPDRVLRTQDACRTQSVRPSKTRYTFLACFDENDMVHPNMSRP